MAVKAAVRQLHVYMDGIYLKRNWGGESTPRARMTEVAAMLKAIHAQESKEAARFRN